jgi:hypothetical protein
MSPFVYPAQQHVRRHGPQGYQDIESFRPWLRDEFSFRCVVCLRREAWDRAVSMEIDHFQPIKQVPELRLDYDNLLYACSRCNAAKGAQQLPDPTKTLLEGSVTVQADGQIVGHTDEARRLILALRLNGPDAVHFRRLWIEIVTMAARFGTDLYGCLMGYPDDLPDLARLRPPAGNARPEGISQSSFARRQRNELPVIY